MMLQGDYMQLERFTKKVSVAIRLMDDYTSNSILGDAAVSIKDTKTAAVKSISGYYAFTDLPARAFTLVIQSDYYRKVEMDITQDELTASSVCFKEVALIPHSAYPFPAGATLVRGVLSDSTGRAIAGAAVRATVIQPEKTVRATLAKDTPVGRLSVYLSNIDRLSDIHEGDIYMIRDPLPEALECCRIIPPLAAAPDTEPFNLEKPLRFNHKADTPLSTVSACSLNTFTDDRGEFVVYAKSVKTSALAVQLSVNVPYYKPYDTEVTLKEGEMKSQGVILLYPV